MLEIMTKKVGFVPGVGNFLGQRKKLEQESFLTNLEDIDKVA